MTDTIDTPAGRSTGALRDFVRSSWLLLAVQALVALLALGAIGFAVVQIPPLITQREALEAENEKLSQSIAAARRTMGQKREAYRFLEPSLAALARNDYETALDSARRANEISADDPEILRAFSNASYGMARRTELSSEVRAAHLQTAIEARRRAHELDAAVLEDVVAIATYQCTAGAASDALVTLSDAAFLEAARQNTSLIIGNEELLGPCNTIRRPLEGLMGAQDAADPSLFQIRDVLIHIRNERDRPRAEILARELRQRNFRVPGIELIAPPTPYEASVRYYYNSQEPQAQSLRAAISAIARGENDLSAWRTELRLLPLEGSFQGLPRNRIEIWMPGEAPLPPAPVVAAAGSNQQLARYLDAYTSSLARGFTPVPGQADRFTELRPGASVDWRVPVHGNLRYRAIGGCDNACSNVDIRVLDPSGALIHQDVYPDDYPIGSINNASPGEYTIRLTMVTCQAAACRAGLRFVQAPVVTGEAAQRELTASAQQVTRWLNETTNDNGRGYVRADGFRDEVRTLAPNAEARVGLNLRAGATYRLLGACDNECTNVDLELIDPSGSVIGRDVAEDDTPIIDVTPAAAGQYTVRMSVRVCGAERCGAGLRVLTTSN